MISFLQGTALGEAFLNAQQARSQHGPGRPLQEAVRRGSTDEALRWATLRTTLHSMEPLNPQGPRHHCRERGGGSTDRP